jgi:predicted transcriptional regulator
MEYENLRDIHIKIDQETLERVRKLCTHKGDLTWHLQQAVLQYLEKKEKKIKPLKEGGEG